MGRALTEPRWCNRIGCDARIIFARRAEQPIRWVPLEEQDRSREETIGCLVLVDGTAWKPGDLVEHFMTRFEIAEPKARDLVADYPHHRPHYHEPETTTKENQQ